MYSQKEVLVITTETPSAGKIKKHLQPVTAHVVAGTNLFSDFFAGMSDIFGGRSEGYKKQLSSIYTEAIESIRYEAKKIGANGVVGLKIDIDEISGQGKSMFMITAIGTAVIIEGEYVKENNGKEFSTRSGIVLNEDVQRLRQRKLLLEQLENNEGFEFNAEDWEFITSNRYKEFFPFILPKLTRLLKYSDNYMTETVDAFQKSTKHYLQSLNTDDRVEMIYQALMNYQLNSKVRQFLLKIIKEEFLIDYGKISDLLNSNHLEVQKSGLIIATFDLEFYNVEDENEQLKLISKIEEVFKNKSEITTKKGILSSKEKPVWKCECGKLNNEDNTYCTQCLNDVFGFSYQEKKPATAIHQIKERLLLLKEFQI